MKCTLAVLAAMTLSFAALLGGSAAAQDPPPAELPADIPPALLDDPAFQARLPYLLPLARLGSLGLLRDYASFELFATADSRMISGRFLDRLRPLIPPGTDPETDVTFVVGSLNNIHPTALLGDMPLYLRGNVVVVDRNEAFDFVEPDATIYRVDGAVAVAPSVRSFLSLGGYFEHTEADIGPIGATVDSTGLGVRADVLYAFDNNFALAARLDYAYLSERFEGLPPAPPPIVNRFGQDRHRIYTELVLSRTITDEELSFLTDAFTLRPELNFSYLHNDFIEETNAAGFEENYATFGGAIRLEGKLGPRKRFQPYAEVGLATELNNTYDELIGEDLTVNIEGGLTFQIAPGNIINAGVSYGGGTEGRRQETTFVLNASFTF